jgi:Cu-Zn family superoxide dismutase
MTNLSVIGHAVVVHAGPDLCVQPYGAAGALVAQGVIGITNLVGNTADNRLPSNPLSASAWMFRTIDQVNANATFAGSLQFHAVTGAPGQSWVRVIGAFTGLTAGFSYGLHVHEFADDNSTNGLSTGGHYDPYRTSRHGMPMTTYRHMGDMGNILANASGVAVIDQVFNLLTLIPNCYGIANIIGRGVVLHAGPDDGVTQPNGNSGTRWMVGTIGISGRNPPAYTPTVVTPAYVAKAVIRGSSFPLYSNFTATVTLRQGKHVTCSLSHALITPVP